MFRKYATLIRDEYLIELKLLAVLKEKKIYELIDEAIKGYLEKDKQKDN